MPRFVDHQSAARSTLRHCLYISAISTPRKRHRQEAFLALRAIMISQEVDLVASDFDGTAWRCSNRDNISSIDEAFTDCALPTPPAPTPLWGPGLIPNNWADVCGFLNPTAQIGIGRYARMVRSPSHEEHSACDRLIKVAIMKHGFVWISPTGATLGPSKATMIGTFTSKTDLQLVHTGTKNDVLAKS